MEKCAERSRARSHIYKAYRIKVSSVLCIAEKRFNRLTYISCILSQYMPYRVMKNENLSYLVNEIFFILEHWCRTKFKHVK